MGHYVRQDMPHTYENIINFHLLAHKDLEIVFQNGYPGKTRSLVGDAKFEKLVRRESRMSFFQHDSETDGSL